LLHRSLLKKILMLELLALLSVLLLFLSLLLLLFLPHAVLCQRHNNVALKSKSKLRNRKQRRLLLQPRQGTLMLMLVELLELLDSLELPLLPLALQLHHLSLDRVFWILAPHLPPLRPQLLRPLQPNLLRLPHPLPPRA